MTPEQLSRKEEVFCIQLALTQNLSAAAHAAGYTDAYAKKLCNTSRVTKQLALLGKQPTAPLILSALQRLALGSAGNLSALLAADEATPASEIDLFHVAKIKRDKDLVEITFHDRQRALETLLNWCNNDRAQPENDSLLEALKQAAATVKTSAADLPPA